MTAMPFAGRLLVGLNGQEPDVHLIRYAAMVARLHQQAGPAVAEKLPSAPLPAGPDPEVRFVYLFPCAKRTAADAPPRSALRAQVDAYFTALPRRAAIGYDVLKGDALERLSAFAADFDSDLLLLGRSTWSPGACARIALEAPCPVWLVPPGWAPVLRRLLVPCDFSEHSAAALRAAVDIARRSWHAKCLVLHVYWTGSRFSDEPIRAIQRRQLLQSYDRFLAGIETHGVTAEPLFVEGPRVDREIIQAAGRHGVDLIVMTTRGRTRPARMLLPSITDLSIRGSQASYLVLRGADRPVGLLPALCQRLDQRDEPHFS